MSIKLIHYPRLHDPHRHGVDEDQEVVATLASSALESLVAMGRVSADDVRVLIDAAAARIPKGGNGPWVGDTATMEGTDTAIKVASLPEEQPEAKQGIWTIVDQYGESHRVEEEGDDWIVLIPAI